MAFRKALTWFPTLVVILTVVSIPFVQSSRTRLQDGTTMAGRKDAVTQGFETHDEIYGNGASVLSVEDSAREVPTGPDPLHHNSNPAGP